MPIKKSPANVKKFTKKSVEKVQYASKVIGKIIDDVIQVKLSTIKKNPKTTSKWLEKMKVSIQRKISDASRTSFTTIDSNPEYLKKEILKMKEKIENQVSNIRNKALVIVKQDHLSLKETKIQPTYVQGSFESNVTDVKKSYSQIAYSVNSIKKDIDIRIDALESAVHTVETNLPKFKNIQENKNISPTRNNNINNKNQSSINKDKDNRNKNQIKIANMNAHLFNEK